MLNNELDIIDEYSQERTYKRLSDVDIDICLPSKKYKIEKRLYEQDLIVPPDENPKWYTENKIDSIISLLEHSFGNDTYIMLYGIIDQRINEEYNNRFYLLAETFFIHKNEHFKEAKEISGKEFSDWEKDNHFSPDHLRQIYFGELYWADNIGEHEYSDVGIRTGEIITIQRKLDIRDAALGDQYAEEDIGKQVEEEIENVFHFQSETTLAEYLWESDSLISKGYREYYPALKMGKALGLKADPKSSEILDSDLNSCFKCVEYNKNLFENKFNYMRSDLLRKYMLENNLALLVQVKQHSYDQTYFHNRLMKYFIVE